MRTFIFSLAMMLATTGFGKNLTHQDVESWLNTYKQVEAWGEKHPETRVQLEKPELNYARIFSSALEQVKKQNSYSDLASLLKKNGYSDPKEWAQIGDRIFLALAASEMSQFTPEDLQQQIKMMEISLQSANISDAQKAILKETMEKSRQAIEAAAATPKEDIEVVQQFRNELGNFLNLEDE